MQNTDARQYVNQILQKGKKEIRAAFLGGSLSKGEMVKKEEAFVSLFEQKLPTVLGQEWRITILRHGESVTSFWRRESVWLFSCSAMNRDTVREVPWNVLRNTIIFRFMT